MKEPHVQTDARETGRDTKAGHEQEASFRHSDASFILPSLPGAFGIPCRCESAQLTHAASTVAYFARVDEGLVVSNGVESACAALR